MIIKGKSRSEPSALAAHLGNAEKNERVQLLETKGTVATDLRGALIEMDAYAVGTRCEKPLYHAALSAEPPHRLSPQQRGEAITALEERLGLTGHARVVVMHEKEGREHIHVVWSRIDLEHMRSASDSHNYRKHEEVARELERRFGHDRVQGAHAERDGVERPDRTPSRAELRQEDRTGITGKQVKADVTAAFRASDGPDAFKTALEQAGYLLAKGDKRDFVVLDQAGGVHSLARRLDGIKAAELRAYMAPIDRDSLPDIEQAKTMQLARAPAKAARPEPQADSERTPGDGPVGDAEPPRRQREDDERRARDLAAAAGTASKAEADTRADDKIAAAYGRGDDYVNQSRAAQQDFERRQDRLNESHPGDASDNGRQDDRNIENDIGRERAEAEDWDRQRRQEQVETSEHARQDAPAAPPASGKSDTVEITDRMARLLGQLYDRPDRSLSPDDALDRHREAPGGGRTRSR